ncbi:sugar transferase [filamentous cyanobacterium CCP3]|nr:sugar transferase [filamentous cyanobacterium CCP3]
MDGICTLGNDRVYDQIVALINSIDIFAPKMPVCIYPYDDRVDRLRELVRHRPSITLYDNTASIQRWDAWVEQLWATHPTARQRWDAIGSAGIHRMGTHRRFCAFDGPFDRFIYMDADTLLLGDPAPVFDALSEYDWVTYDFQHKDLSHVYDVNSGWMEKLFSAEQLQRQAFCSGFYASRLGLFDPDNSQDILNGLKSGESAVLYPMAPDQTILNYLVMRQQVNSCNLALILPPEQRTGNSVTSSHFTVEDYRVYDKGVPLLYLHYIGLSSKLFARLCNGENVDLPYREVFLHYRYRHEPENRPPLMGKLVTAKPQGWRRYLKPLAQLLP